MYRREILMVILITGFVFGFYFIYLFGKIFFWDNTVFEEEKIYIYIDEGYDFMELKSILTPYLKSISDFTSAAKKKDYINRVKPGKYLLLKGSNNNDIINTLRSKSLTVRVTFNNQELLEDLNYYGDPCSSYTIQVIVEDNTLEWSVSSPPAFHTFEKLPSVR